MNGGRVLVHMTTPAQWRAALTAGALAPASYVTDGFVHLSEPDQVTLPANRLHAGRDDLLLLVIDRDRLPSDALRYEPGVPSDPAAMRFPHLYAMLPTAAVTSVVPFRPGPDGTYEAPSGLPRPDDLAARALGFDRSLALRRAAAVLPVHGGVAVLDPRVAHSYEHNTLWMSGPTDAATVRTEADRVLGPAAHRRAVFDAQPPNGLGWETDEFRILVRSPDAPAPTTSDVAVVAVAHESVARLWDRMWRRQLPGVSDDAVADLIRREPLADAHCQVVDLVVANDDDPCSAVPWAGAQLRIDGATAAIEAVLTVPEARGRGLARALVDAAIARALAAGCDAIFLAAAADDWPRRWYERLGFVDVGGRWESTARS